MMLRKQPTYWDVLVLSSFTVLITWHPYFLHGKINIFEIGLYLPGIQSVLNGEIPYRDVFHLRGPLELYVPALLMKLFGVHIGVLYSYFYVGSVLCLIFCALIAKEVLKRRFILYLFVPVLIARTFPRVVFTYWGGMRYALGLLAVWFIIKFFKSEKPRWLLGAGIVSALASLTSIEMGIYAGLGALAALAISFVLKVQDRGLVAKGLGMYLAGIALIAVPYGLYLAVNSALVPYWDATLTIVSNMQNVIDPHLVSVYPRNFSEAFAAMINPVHTNFKHMTPSYLYILLLVYLFWEYRNKKFSREDLMLICLGIYGFIMYNTGFRGIWAAQFEMALQPEKILLFFFAEMFLFLAIDFSYKKRTAFLICLRYFLIVAMIGSSLGYAIARYNHRFFVSKFIGAKIRGKDTAYLRPLSVVESRPLRIERAKGIIVPAAQADELEQIQEFIRTHVAKDEVLFTYPELGTYNFLVDRRFYGRFPLATFTWFNDRWHAELLGQLNSSRPRYIILGKEIPQYWKDVYLGLEPNRKKFQQMMDFIHSNYVLVHETPRSGIYQLK